MFSELYETAAWLSRATLFKVWSTIPGAWRPFQRVYKIKTHFRNNGWCQSFLPVFIFALLEQQMPYYKPRSVSHHRVHHHALGVKQILAPFQNVLSDAFYGVLVWATEYTHRVLEPSDCLKQRSTLSMQSCFDGIFF